MLAAVMTAALAAPAAFAASAAPKVLYLMDETDTAAELTLSGLPDASVYAVQLTLSAEGAYTTLTLQPEDTGALHKLETGSDGTVTLYLDSQAPLNSAQEKTTLKIGMLTANGPFQLLGQAKLRTLDAKLRPTDYESIAVTKPAEEPGGDAGGDTGGGSHGSSGSGASKPQQTQDALSVTANESGAAALTQSALAKAKTLTVKGAATLTFDEAAVDALRAAGKEITVRAAAAPASGESRAVRAQLNGAALYTISVEAGGAAVPLGGGACRVSVPFTGKGRPAAYLVDEQGGMTRLGETAEQDGAAAFTLTAPQARVAVLDVVHRFADVDGWYDAYVNTMAENGVMNGVSADSFQPEKPMTRAELVTTLARLSGDTPGGSAAFSDVKQGDWFAPYVAWAQQSGVTSGVTADRFMPQSEITREQMAVMLTRFADYAHAGLTEEQPAAAFSDAAQISPYAQAAMARMQRAGILSGRGDGRIDPKGIATRAECAKMLSILLQEMPA